MSVGEGNDVPFSVLGDGDCGAFHQLCLLVLADQNSYAQRVESRYLNGARTQALWCGASIDESIWTRLGKEKGDARLSEYNFAWRDLGVFPRAYRNLRSSLYSPLLDWTNFDALFGLCSENSVS